MVRFSNASVVVFVVLVVVVVVVGFLVVVVARFKFVSHFALVQVLGCCLVPPSPFSPAPLDLPIHPLAALSAPDSPTPRHLPVSLDSRASNSISLSDASTAYPS